MARDKMSTTNQNAGGATVGSRMTHSLSTPSGVDGSSAPINRGGKKLAIRIQMLDDSVTLFQVQVSAPRQKVDGMTKSVAFVIHFHSSLPK